jgi:PDZ domain
LYFFRSTIAFLIILISVSLASGEDAQLAKPPPGWLGLIWDTTQADARIKKIVLGSPAQSAGLKSGDVVVGVNDQKFEGAGTRPKIVVAIKETGRGKTIKIEVNRGGTRIETSAVLEDLQNAFPHLVRMADENKDVDAMFALGQMYRDGQGEYAVMYNGWDFARSWFEKAAKAGHKEATAQLQQLDACCIKNKKPQSLEDLREQLDLCWAPHRAKYKKLEKVQIQFFLAADGGLIKKPKVLKLVGTSDFAAVAVQAVLKCAPFRMPPKEKVSTYKSANGRVEIPIIWDLQ